MSFVYPRTISVRRANVNTGVGAQPYSGTSQTAETEIVTGLPASIQLKTNSSRPEADLPSDAYYRTGWRIYIPLWAAENGTITERDIIVDDLSKRYQVVAAYWNSLGYNLDCELLEV